MQQPERCCRELFLYREAPMRRVLFVLLSLGFVSLAAAQAVDAVKEAGHATAEKSKQAGDEVKSAFASEPNKSIDKAKAHAHKARAHHAAHEAKEDAKAAVGH